MYYYQEFKNDFDLAELENFIINSLNIKNIKIYKKNEFQYIDNSVNKHKFFRPIKSFLFKYYVLYIMILCSCFYFFELNNTLRTNPFNEVRAKTKDMKNSLKYTFLSKVVLELYENEKKFNVKISSIVTDNTNIVLTLNSSDKASIYNFLNEYKNHTIENMFYDEKEKRYKTNANFQLY